MQQGPRRGRKIGVVTEGDSEVGSLSLLYGQLHSRLGKQLMKPILADIDPKAPVPVIARGIAERIRLAIARGATSVVVILDLEDLQECAGQRAIDLQNAIGPVVGCHVSVVIKVRKFENWLVAAPSALESQPARFPEAALVRTATTPNKSDTVPDAEQLLKKVTVRRDYDKRRDSIRILQRADVAEMASNSRSFRRFLAVLGDPAYRASSHHPQAPA